MDFVPHGHGQQHHQSEEYWHGQHQAHHQPTRAKHIDWAARTVRIELFIVLLGCSLILAAVALFLGFNSPTSNSEFDKVASNKYQAVFLNGGTSNSNDSFTTYFGHIKKINDKYYVLQDVYYLTASQSKSASQQLTKLGCDQLHAPYDQMIIDRDQVAFWENIRDDGTVGKAIAAYKQKFPNGPKCNSSATKSSTTPTSTTPSSTTPATTTPSTVNQTP